MSPVNPSRRATEATRSPKYAASGSICSNLSSSTARTNTRAQALYESLGWQRDDVYLTYSLSLPRH